MFTVRCNLCSCLPFFFGVLAVESQDHESTAYNTHKHGDTVFRAIRHKEIKINTETNTNISTRQSPSLFSGCRHFISGFRDTYSESLRVKRAEKSYIPRAFGLLSGSVHPILHLSLSSYKIVGIIVQSFAHDKWSLPWKIGRAHV